MKHIIVFVKNPELGKVKTRIAKDSDDNTALAIYTSLLEITKGHTSKVIGNRHLYYSSFIDHNDQWPESDFKKSLQSGEDLGERMCNAFREIFSMNVESGNRVIVIGSDCPELDDSMLELALGKLLITDVVLGPTFDGGYYLLGMSKFTPELFEGIEWSTEAVFNQTINKVENAGLTISILPKLQDIDHLVDWNNYKTRNSII